MMREDLLKAYVAHDSNRSRLYVEKGYWTEGHADKKLDYAATPIRFLYSIGLRPPKDILIRLSRYHTIYSSI